jgi:uncharacterized protein YecE (DUF72 family)
MTGPSRGYLRSVLKLGTSGWQYKDWRGRFYPEGLPQRLWLEHYVTEFDTVELNNAFYRLPERSTFERWRERTPPDFEMTVKCSRYLTHIKRLREPREPVERFMDRASGLGKKLGPVLLQLPPTMKVDVPALDETLRLFPKGVRLVVEPRHKSWWTDEVRRTLESYNAALSWSDRDGRPVAPLWRTADFGYLRLHHGRAHPRPRYGRQALATWVRRLREAFPADADTYVYFNNDPGGAAIVDARAFRRLAAT